MNKTLKIKVYNQRGKIIKDKELNPQIFMVEPDQYILHRVATAQMANQRKPVASTKDRSEVRGGGAKPWRQKGTGRARHGSIRSPIWKGGGVTFGPTYERNFKKKINKKEKRKALFMSLSAKAKEKRLVLVDRLELKEFKTKNLVRVLKNLPCGDKSTLIVLDRPNTKVKIAGANLPVVNVKLVNTLNIIDILKYEYLLLTEEALQTMEKLFIK